MARGLPTHMKDEPHIRLWMNFFDDAEEAGIPLPAATAYLQMVCRCRQGRSDGWIHQARITKDRIPAKHVRVLEDAGWLLPDPSGAPRWFIVAYPKWNKVEQDYQRDRHNGRVGGCRSKHPQPCDRPDCLESQAWLATHPQPPLGPVTNPPLTTPLTRPDQTRPDQITTRIPSTKTNLPSNARKDDRMTTADNRELLALRTHLATHLEPPDAKALAWPVVASAAGPGIGRGWGGAELAASALLGAYSGGVDSVPAYVITNLRSLAEQDPPRQRTDTPPTHLPPGTLRATNPSTRTAQHIATIRQTIRRTPA